MNSQIVIASLLGAVILSCPLEFSFADEKTKTPQETETSNVQKPSATNDQTTNESGANDTREKDLAGDKGALNNRAKKVKKDLQKFLNLRTNQSPEPTK